MRGTAKRAFTRTERDEEAAGDDLMAKLGFRVWRHSPPERMRVTSGWPDRLYTNIGRGVAVWWEAKRDGGRVRPGQLTFEHEVRAAGHHYVRGPAAALAAWAAEQMRRGWPASTTTRPAGAGEGG